MSTKREPFLWEALVSLLSLVVAIGLAIVKYETAPHVPMLIGAFVAAIMAYRAGYKWKEIEKGMMDGITNALQAIVILSVIGVLVGVWILSGTVPTMIYYGLQILSPKIFLVATVLICSITSLATGSSWGTAGTIGVALMGVGEGLGMPMPIVAGAVLSGAYFGDKMSPLSDTTNLAPAMAGSELFEHIKHMVYTTGTSYIIVLIIETVLGFVYGGGSVETMGRVNQILEGLSSQFNISLILLLPPIIVIGLAIKKIPAIPGISMGIVSGAILGVIFQGNNFGQILNAAYNGYISETGVTALDSLLTNGGFTAMLYSISIVITAMMFGGIMENTNQLKVIVDKILQKAQSDGSLIAATILSAIGMNVVLSEQYMSIVVTGRMYAQAYKDQGLHPKNLSRALEDSGTVTGCLVPWNTGGAYMSSTLGVATVAYLPFAFFNWLTPIVSIIFGLLGITIEPIDEAVRKHLDMDETEAETV
ncbi:Na+/H+ antiporter NhaC [Selenihalanaerobacter shriftii]|uniref:Transporter, NhaC family (TC 2.A.35) n=1 Tax=Selenihalanaerobacter shriftii TaxID=142842 RepID=A0A1T4PXA6_9FIRM|nr:Na+/H+ antiporter NhaC [Selenihalanaerobacter shriftii]SJZ95966.1 transporter, NhaC family (TC 2.A.35) [Selenihalanaerobacter shriftii]